MSVNSALTDLLDAIPDDRAVSPAYPLVMLSDIVARANILRMELTRVALDEPEPLIDSDKPKPYDRGTILGVGALALSIVALCVAVFT